MQINFEFRKGLLFVRLSGILNKENSVILSTKLDNLINEKGVKYFVMNLENLDFIDKEGIKIIKDRYKEIALHDGKLVICGCQNNYLKTIIDEEIKGAYKSENELAAFKLIHI